MKITDHTEIARRMIESLSSDLHAFIIDKDLVDTKIVQKIITISGIDVYIRKFARENIIIYVLDTPRIKRKCMYEECIDEKKENLNSCLDKCFVESLRKVTNEIINSISETLKSLSK